MSPFLAFCTTIAVCACIWTLAVVRIALYSDCLCSSYKVKLVLVYSHYLTIKNPAHITNSLMLSF